MQRCVREADSPVHDAPDSLSASDHVSHGITPTMHQGDEDSADPFGAFDMAPGEEEEKRVKGLRQVEILKLRRVRGRVSEGEGVRSYSVNVCV